MSTTISDQQSQAADAGPSALRAFLAGWVAGLAGNPVGYQATMVRQNKGVWFYTGYNQGTAHAATNLVEQSMHRAGEKDEKLRPKSGPTQPGIWWARRLSYSEIMPAPSLFYDFEVRRGKFQMEVRFCSVRPHEFAWSPLSVWIEAGWFDWTLEEPKHYGGERR